MSTLKSVFVHRFTPNQLEVNTKFFLENHDVRFKSLVYDYTNTELIITYEYISGSAGSLLKIKTLKFNHDHVNEPVKITSKTDAAGDSDSMNTADAPID